MERMSINKIYRYLLLTTMMLYGITSYAETIYPTNGVSVNGSTFYYGASYTTNDGLPGSTTYGTTRAIITLGIDWGIIDYNAVFNVDSSYVIDVKITVKGWNPGVGTPTSGNNTYSKTDTLTLVYNPRQNVTEIDKAVHTFTNVRQAEVTISGIMVNGIAITSTSAKLPQPLTLTTDLIVERYQTFNTGTTPSGITLTNLNNNQIRCNWNAMTGAEDYDVEWTWVDALANPQNYDFTHNSSRVTVPASSGTSYIIPTAYPNGKVIVRVRGRGRDLTIAPDFSRHTYGTWSIAASGSVGSISSSNYFNHTTGLEEEKNWQFTTTFSEQGKRQDVIQYFDGTLRNRQSITRLNVLDSAALVGETFYDHIGRPSIQVLPVPDVADDTSYNHLQYRELFNRDKDDNQFTYDDFDTDTTDCDGLIVNPMSTDYGAAYYYSENNPLQSNTPGNIYNYLPKANGFPYTQVEYMPDNTNRIRRQSGVGVTHRLTGTDEDLNSYTGKETRYYYGTPFQVQLDRLFGNEVGRYKHYKKNLVIDANGQISVSYLDPYGRVIATALAGDTITTPNLIPLESSNSSAELECNLLDSMQIDYNTMSITATATHLVTSPGIHGFSYSVATPSYTNCLPENWCFDCIYDLTLSIKDECGLELVPESLQTQTVGEIDPLNTTCDSITFTLAPDPLEIELENPGNYVITKKLAVNQAALDYYTEQFLANSPCILPLDSFIADAMNDIDTTDCYGGCDDCLEKLGDYSEHSDTNYRYTAGYEYMTQAEYDHAVEVCNAMCQTPTPCSVLYKQILADVSPGGQYMEYDLTGVIYTADDTLSLLNMSYGALGDYADISTYENPDGTPSTITIGTNTYSPQNLPLNLFLEHWQESWAESLAPLHPEYCYYQTCAANEDSYIYDNNMLLTSTFTAARDSGFLNPIGSNTDTVPFHIEHKDPFFAPYSGSPYNEMATALDDFAGDDTTAWELITIMQNSGQSSFSGNGDCWTDYDWGMFRGAYLSTKQTFLQAMYEGISDCPDFGSYPNDPFVLGIKTPRFILNAYDALGDENLTGYDVNVDENSSPQDVQNEALSHIEDFCDTLCTSYAEQWMYSLNGCGMSDVDSIEIRSRLITACRGNCDATNPLGGIEEAQVTDILEDVLGPSYMTADCNPIGIIQPSNYGQGAFGMVPMDSCACDKVLNAHIQFDTLTATGNLPIGICSEQEMFTHLYGSDASMVNYDQLECYCLQQGYYTNDTIVTSTSSGPVTTLIAPNCDMYMDYYTQSDTITAVSYTSSLIEFFNQHWAKDSCEEGTFYLENLSLPLGFLGDESDCFTTYTTDNTYAIDTVYVYFNPDSLTYYEFDIRLDSLVNYLGTFYIHDTNYVSLIEYQTIHFDNPCGDDCEMIITAPPCLNGNLYWADYLYCESDFQLTFYGSVAQDSTLNECSGGYYSPFGPGIYAVLGSAPFNGHGDGKFMIWTDCFSMGDTIIHASNFDTTMYVPYGLACEQCFTCAMLDSAQAECFEKYPFLTSLVSTDYHQVIRYVADYVNDNYNFNFTAGQYISFYQNCQSSEDPDTLELCYEPMFTTYHDPHQECVDFLIATALSNAESNYNEYIDSVTAAFRQQYITKCLGAFETFTMEYTEREFHYTLYYYDQAGNLIKTVPPEGVEVITSSAVLDTVELYRNNPGSYSRIIPDHELITDYRYTTLNQPARQHTPDGGITLYWYDILGRLVVSQNAKQAVSDMFSYTKYDDLGRITQVGEIQHDTVMTAAHAANSSYLNQWINAGTKSQVTCTFYDEARPNLGAPFTGTGGVQKNLRNRVAYTTFETTYNSSDTIYDVATHYSYDIHGNVFELVQEVVVLADQQSRFKLMEYEFDLISGKVLEVAYQRGEKDQYYHQYEYTHDNKLTKAKTSRDYIIWDEDASYQYYMYGAMARTELGDNEVQGVDYAYTIHGWIKGINSNTLSPNRDIGKDGYESTSGPSNAHQNFCKDIAGFSLGYYRATNGSTVSDYQSISTFASANFFIASIDTLTNVISTNQASLFNGNISHMITSLPNCSTFTASQTFSSDPLGTVYRYDQLNRIKWMKAYSDPANLISLNRWGTGTTNDGQTYHTNYKYDANGNLLTLGRWGDDLDSLEMDSISYSYATSIDPYYSGQVLNRLDTIGEYQTSQMRYKNDLDNNSYYSYDEIGNMTADLGEDIQEIQWSVYGKVLSVTRYSSSYKSDLEFKYNASGQRYLKIEKPRNGTTFSAENTWRYTYYTHDAQGNIMATYTLNYEEDPNEEVDYFENFKMSNFVMYGSSRLGIKNDTALLNKRSIIVDSWTTDERFLDYSAGQETVAGIDTTNVSRETGYKNYEISNHLGNVLATVTDRKVPISVNDTIVDYWMADINTLTDYYPFGSEMPGRNLAISNCHSEIVSDTVFIIQQDFESYVETDYGPHAHQKITYAGFRQEYDSHVNIEPRSGSDRWARVLSDDDSYGFTKISNTITLATQYTLKFDIDLGTATSMIVDVYTANSSGTPISLLKSDTATTSADGDSFNFTTVSSGTNNKLFIRFRQSDNATRKIFYLDDVRLYITSSGVDNFNENLNTPTISGVAQTTIKHQYDAWTPWSHSQVFYEEDTIGDMRLNVVTFVSNHGNQRYFDGLTAGKSYKIDLNIEMGTASQVRVFLWDVNGVGAVSNERVILTASADGNHYGTFTPLYNKVLVQVRRSSGSNFVYFYMDDFKIYETLIREKVNTVCSTDSNSYPRGFNSMLKDNEMFGGDGNSYDFGARLYNPRLGRWMACDPLEGKYPYLTPYNYSANNPIFFVDQDGRDIFPANEAAKAFILNSIKSVFKAEDVFIINSEGYVEVNKKAYNKAMKTLWTKEQKELARDFKKVVNNKNYHLRVFVADGSVKEFTDVVDAPDIITSKRNSDGNFSEVRIEIPPLTITLPNKDANTTTVKDEYYGNYGWITINTDDIKNLPGDVQTDENVTIFDESSTFFHETLDHFKVHMETGSVNMNTSDKGKQVENYNKAARASGNKERTGKRH